MQSLVSILAATCLVISCHAGAQTPRQSDESDRRVRTSPDAGPATTEAAADAPVDPERLIIWHPERPTEAAFVPQLLLQEQDLAGLPLTAEQREDVQKWIEQRRNPERYYPPFIVTRGIPCLDNLSGPAHENNRAEDAKSITELVREAPVALVGQVVAIVHGKDDLLLGIGRMVYIEVKEIVSAAEAAKEEMPDQGDLIAVLKEGGTINVAGVTICEEMPAELDQPEVGDWLLVLGEPPVSGSPLIPRSTTFPINGEDVMPQPYHRLRPGESPQELRLIRSAVRAGG